MLSERSEALLLAARVAGLDGRTLDSIQRMTTFDLPMADWVSIANVIDRDRSELIALLEAADRPDG